MFGIVLDFGLTGLFLLLDGIVYWLVSKLFALYAALAGAEIIKNELFQQITSRIYVVIGIFMLFVMAYSLLKSLVNPDNLAKDTGKMVTNIIVSLVLFSVVPVIFEYARTLQNVIISENVIGNIILENPDENIVQTGRNVSLSILESFLYIPDSELGYSSNERKINFFGKEFDPATHTFDLKDVDGSTVTWGELKEYIREGADANFMKIGYWAESVHEESNGSTYIMFVSTLTGVFLAYVLLSFCLDLGVRVIKLAFYQLIAPIPIMMRILPEKKSVFDNWVKAIVATYMEVFIRLFIMFIVVWLVSAIFDGNVLALSENVGVFGTVIVVLGIFAFAKQAPKLIGDVIGVDSGNIKLGIGGKLAAGGAFGIGAILGGATTAGIRNLTHGFENSANKWADVRNQKGILNKFKASGKAIGATVWDTVKTPFRVPSVAAGFLSGGVRSAKSGFSAKTFRDVAKAAGEGAAGATTARNKREAYRASHSKYSPLIHPGVYAGHVSDAIKGFGTWAGLNASSEGLKKIVDIYQKGLDYKKELEELALKKSTQAKVYEQQIDALNQKAILREAYKSDAAYSAALIQRANEVDQLKRAKDFAVMKEISDRLGNLGDIKNAEFAEIVNSFQTFKKQNANLLSNISDLSDAGWDSAWNGVDPMTISKAVLDGMKSSVTYTSNDELLKELKNEAAKKYAERIQKEQEKK